ncbi:TauD/TfdA family dioxygenase [Actinocorallia populi]|uniref:TauD/TfdA family dioxygenase n=1 Tax=Actinocorallia populi TaxID=2079200 RepID=UPI000D090973|nr:TauD/TfdA family dioxygenase [Actinocorallia populi]
MAPTTRLTTLDLTPALSAAVHRTAAVVTANPYSEPELFVAQAKYASGSLPAPVRDALAALRTHQDRVALLIRGLPLPWLVPETPRVRFDFLASQTPLGTEGILGVLGSAVGEIFAYREWDRGHLVQNRYPIASHTEVQASSGSAELVLHTEASFADVSPDHLVLMALRADPAGKARTSVCDIGLALSRLTERARERLKRPEFAFETDQGTHLSGGRRMTKPQPISRAVQVEYAQSLVGCTRAACKALDELAAAFGACAVNIALEPGDALVIDNRRAVHGRTAFTPAYDGTDRWLQRLLLRHPSGDGACIVSDSRAASYPSSYRRTLALPN